MPQLNLDGGVVRKGVTPIGPLDLHGKEAGFVKIKSRLIITVITNVKPTIVDGEDITKDISKAVNDAILEKIEKDIHEDDSFEADVLDSVREDSDVDLPKKMDDFPSLGSVSIEFTSEDIMNLVP